MKRIYLIAACMVALIPAASAQTTQRLSASKANDYGLVYSLPITEVDITIEVEHTLRAPGEFHNYARRNLAISDAVTAESQSATVKSVTFTPRGVADPANRWTVQFKSGSNVSMLLSADGIPLAVNAVQPAALSLPALPEAQPKKPTALETEAARQAMTQEIIRSSSLSKRAELAARRIFELRDMRSDLLSGQTDNPPADGQAMQLMLDNLAGQEAALTAMFAGTVSTYTSVGTVSYTADSNGTSSEVIARISPTEGVIDSDNLAGAPVYLTVKILEEASLPVNEKGEVKKFPKGGLAYTIPGTARFSVSYAGSVIAEADIPLAQLGVTFGLDPALFSDKKAPSQLLFDPNTGGVLYLGPATEQ